MKLILATIIQTLTVLSAIDSADAASTTKVICGGGSSSKKCGALPPKMADKEERYGARCCSPSPFFNSEHKTKNGCTNYAGTITNVLSPGLGTTSVDGLYCPWSLTYAEAELFCSNLGATLCTEAEIEGKCAKASGCHLNWEYIWSLDPTTPAPTASPTESPTASPTNAPTDSPTGAPTTSPTDYPTASPIAIDGVRPCGFINYSMQGGQSYTQTYEVDLQGNTGWINIWYYMYQNPDQMRVFYDGQLIYTTGGLVPGEKTIPYYIDGRSNKLYVEMYAPNLGTAWQFKISCL